MANRFAIEGDRLTIEQRRPVARIIVTLAWAGLIVGAVLVFAQKPARVQPRDGRSRRAFRW